MPPLLLPPRGCRPTIRGIVEGFRIADVGRYLGVSHQRVTQMRHDTQMRHERKLPQPDAVDPIGPSWERASIERWAEREWWGTRRWRKPSR